MNSIVLKLITGNVVKRLRISTEDFDYKDLMAAAALSIPNGDLFFLSVDSEHTTKTIANEVEWKECKLEASDDTVPLRIRVTKIETDDTVDAVLITTERQDSQKIKADILKTKNKNKNFTENILNSVSSDVDELTKHARSFMEVTGVADLDLAKRFVQNSKNEVDQAVMEYFSNPNATPPPLHNNITQREAPFSTAGIGSTDILPAKNSAAGSFFPEADVQSLRNMTRCSERHARYLLNNSNGDISAAITAHFDSGGDESASESFNLSTAPIPLSDITGFDIPMSPGSNLLNTGFPQLDSKSIAHILEMTGDNNGTSILGSTTNGETKSNGTSFSAAAASVTMNNEHEHIFGNHDNDSQQTDRIRAVRNLMRTRASTVSRNVRNGRDKSNGSNARKTIQIGHWDMTWDTTSSSKVAMDSTLCNNRYNTNGVTVGEYVSVNTKDGRIGIGIALLNRNGKGWNVKGSYRDSSERIPRVFTLTITEEERQKEEEDKKKCVSKTDADQKEMSDLEKALALSKKEAGIETKETKNDTSSYDNETKQDNTNTNSSSNTQVRSFSKHLEINL